MMCVNREMVAVMEVHVLVVVNCWRRAARSRAGLVGLWLSRVMHWRHDVMGVMMCG